MPVTARPGAAQLLAGERVCSGLVSEFRRDQLSIPVPTRREPPWPPAFLAPLLVRRLRKPGDLETRRTLVTPEAWHLRIGLLSQPEHVLRYIGALISGVLHALEPDRDTVDVLDRDVAHCVDVWIRTAEVLVDDNPMTHLEAAGAREFVTRSGTDTDHDQIGVHVTVTRDHPGDCAVTSEPLDAGPELEAHPRISQAPNQMVSHDPTDRADECTLGLLENCDLNTHRGRQRPRTPAR